MENKIDFKQGYNLAIENAIAHLKAAEIIAQQVNYGIANSLLILSSEEAVKAYMCYAKFYEPNIDIKDFDGFFKDHKLKHKTIKDFFFFINFILESTRVILTPAKKMIKERKDNYTAEELLEKRKEGYQDLISWLKTEPKINYNEQWWNEANSNKNKGFYVNKDGNHWSSPSGFKKEEYEVSHKIVSEVIKHIEQISQIETNKDSQEFYQKIKRIQERK